MKNVKIKCLKEHTPVYSSSGAAGADLRVVLDDVVILPSGEQRLLNTGVFLDMSGSNMCGHIFSRSGLSFNNNLVVANGVGLIDSDYRGEIKVAIRNMGDTSQTIHPGMRIAQIVFSPVIIPNFVHVEEFEDITERGEGGFGSTGHE